MQGSAAQKLNLDAGASSEFSLVDFLLAEQQKLSAVERFAQKHEREELPLQAKYYRELLPASVPEAGEQYAFEVDLDRCSGCKACVSACNQLNGLEEDETWRNVGLLHGGTQEMPVQQTVTSSCHHCVDPACANGCPVNAYEKDPQTGIVRHLDDQCIGCQYCILKCPYGAPQFSSEKGIVRKCDMCSDRLAVGEAPACVQACPSQAIRIQIVNCEKVVEDSEANTFLPGAASPDYTLPTTTYKTERPMPRNLLPADFYSVVPEHSHPPLVFMLVLTQLSVGAFCVERALAQFSGGPLMAKLGPYNAIVALLLGLLAIAASVFHLGRPQWAFRAVIGLRRSWLSREILSFGLFAQLAIVYAASYWILPVANLFGVSVPEAWITPALHAGLGSAVAVVGLGGVFCSVMIYRDTKREYWKGSRSSFKFFGTALVLGAATILFSSTVISVTSPELFVVGEFRELITSVAILLMASSVLKLVIEGSVFLGLRDRRHTTLKRAALLMTGDLKTVAASRFALGILGGVLLPLLLLGVIRGGTMNFVFLVPLVGISFLFSLSGEFLERYLYFTTVDAPRMPGGYRS